MNESRRRSRPSVARSPSARRSAVERAPTPTTSRPTRPPEARAARTARPARTPTAQVATAAAPGPAREARGAVNRAAPAAPGGGSPAVLVTWPDSMTRRCSNGAEVLAQCPGPSGPLFGQDGNPGGGARRLLVVDARRRAGRPGAPRQLLERHLAERLERRSPARALRPLGRILRAVNDVAQRRPPRAAPP
ncbi:uncharacterized protein SOCEGT47_031360 [Sorangium cellulosum]|uniref:Uncharacterized protein n=1 Tax=Sorangium cellulosum TaxID=56 RepID=A0A4V0NDG9_SORCE|nr:uncharacterized protein SOCEGT47_031360 [Sorangium cellulosum]